MAKLKQTKLFKNFGSDEEKNFAFKINADLDKWKLELKNINQTEEFFKLRETNVKFALFLLLSDWSLIVLSFVLASYVPFLIPLCLLVCGSAQRGLANMVHDASHFNLTRNKNLNDHLINAFAALPLFSPIKEYRTSHILHHRFLSHPIFDPDTKMHQRYDYNDMTPPYEKWQKNLLHLLFNFESWKDSNLGSWQEIKLKSKLKCSIWWIFICTILVSFTSIKILPFLLFWQFSRATGYHFVRTVAEFLDHSGLPYGTVLKNSRIVKSKNIALTKFFHPHNDNFHALHHLDPLIPNYNIKKAHNKLEFKSKLYGEIRTNKNYFLGEAAALKDLKEVICTL